MVGITLATIAVALRGEPSTIALAHFAALDAGPPAARRAPAPHRVPAGRARALPGGARREPDRQRASSRRCWSPSWASRRSGRCSCTRCAARRSRPATPRAAARHHARACCARRWSRRRSRSCSRWRSSWRCRACARAWSPARRSARCSRAPASPQRVELGDLGRIRQDPTRRAARRDARGRRARRRTPPTGAGSPSTASTARSWSITPAGPLAGRRQRRGRRELRARARRASNLVQRIVREPVDSGVLFGVGRAARAPGHRAAARARHQRRPLRRGPGARAGPLHDRERRSASWRDAALRDDRAGRRAARRRTATSRCRRSRPRSAALARAHHGERRRSDAERARAIERYLRAHGPLHRHAARPGDPDAPRSPIEAFLLGELAGHCEYFASAMVRARARGRPARAARERLRRRPQNEIGGFVELTRSDAHAWVEVHFERAGWVRYDPTPPDLRLRGRSRRSRSPGSCAELGSALELWWYQRVVGFDRSDQIHALKRAWLAWQSADEQPPGSAARGAALLARLRPERALARAGAAARRPRSPSRRSRVRCGTRRPRRATRRPPTTPQRCACSRAADWCAAPRRPRATSRGACAAAHPAPAAQRLRRADRGLSGGALRRATSRRRRLAARALARTPRRTPLTPRLRSSGEMARGARRKRRRLAKPSQSGSTFSSFQSSPSSART